jgi:hypothetical protein
MRIRNTFHRGIVTAGLAALALATSTAVARPKHDTDPDTDPPDPGGDREPVERPRSQPAQKPDIPGYVLFNSAYYRETTLPLCEWTPGPRSFVQFFYPTQEQQELQEPATWACWIGSRPDTCSLTDAPNYRPTNSSYFLGPRDHYGADLLWPDGSNARNVWGIGCAAGSPASSLTDVVIGSVFEGDAWNGNACGLTALPASRETLLAELVGTDVEHVRPALVRAQVTAGYNSRLGARNITGDLVLAIQVFGEQGWADVHAVAHTTTPQQAHYEVETFVPAGSAVRLQVRGTRKCHYEDYGDGYDIRSMRILVETCIPDQNNPGTCL